MWEKYFVAANYFSDWNLNIHRASDIVIGTYGEEQLMLKTDSKT